MPHQPFTLFKRPAKNGKSIYYARFRLSDGSRGPGKSTGQTSKGGRKDLGLKVGQVVEKENITLEQFSKGFFDWSGSWATNLKVGKKRISQRQCLEKESLLKNDINKKIGSKKLTQIDKSTIKTFRNQLFKEGLAGSTINKTLSIIKVLLEDAEEQKLIQVIPKIERTADAGDDRGILTLKEACDLFAQEWPDLRAYTANITAAVTGLRQGEILALQYQFVKEGYLEIPRSWNQRMNSMNETTKTGKPRIIPIPQKLMDLFSRLKELSPWKSPEAFVFFTPNSPDRPMQGRLATRELYKAMLKIEITEKIRQERKLDFHSWRHWFNSVLINNNIPREKVQAVIGHTTDEMTANYYHPDELADIRLIQEDILLPPKKIG